MSIRIRPLLTASFLALAGLAAGCNGVPSDAELNAGEGTAYLMASEEGDEIGGDAVAGLEESDVAAQAEESSEVLPDASDADSYAPCDFSARKAQVIAQYDTDGDGTLSAEEADALRAEIGDRASRHPRLAKLARRVRHASFWRVKWAFDENGDGTLDETERTALVDAMEARCSLRRANVLERFDANDDGQLSPEELAAARADRRARLQARHDALMTRYDANGDGILDAAERRQLKADLHAALRQRAQRVKSQYDANGDGVLDASELAALKQAIRDRVASGPTAEEEQNAG